MHVASCKVAALRNMQFTNLAKMITAYYRLAQPFVIGRRTDKNDYSNRQSLRLYPLREVLALETGTEGEGLYKLPFTD